jgi:hypothetical protein
MLYPFGVLSQVPMGLHMHNAHYDSVSSKVKLHKIFQWEIF